MTTRFKIGDKIRITNTTILTKREFVGKIAYIIRQSRVIDHTWMIDVDRQCHSWNEYEFELFTVNEKQICNSCKISCPHANPNQKDGTFICVSCLFTKDLEK